MAHDPKVRAEVRARYVQGMPLTSAAEMGEISHSTARNWKRMAKADGDDWDIARAARRMSTSGVEEMTSQVLEEMVVQFLATLEAIKKHETMPPAEKAEILSRLSDAYVKAINSASKGNPRLSKLGVAMEVIRDLSAFIASEFPALHGGFLDALDRFGPELTSKYG